jgi:hypothetical protein
LESNMNPALDHLASNSLRIASEKIAHNTHINQLAERINNAATTLAHVEKTFGAESKQAIAARGELRTLKQQRANVKFPALIDPLPEVEAWLRANPKGEPIEPVTPDIRKGETPLAAYLRRQQLTANILASIRRIETTPLPVEEAVAPLLDQIDKLADQGAPRVVNGRLVVPKVLAGTVSVDNAIGFVAWLDRARIKKSVEDMLSLQDNGPVMSAQERSTSLEKSFVELTDALRQEAAVATEAEKAGQRVVRRRNVHPAILLGLKVVPARVYAYLCKGGRS